MSDQQRTNLFVQHKAFAMPYVHELMLPIKSIAAHTALLDVLTLFDIYSELYALSIQDDTYNRVGIITRYHYLTDVTHCLRMSHHEGHESFYVGATLVAV